MAEIFDGVGFMLRGIVVDRSAVLENCQNQACGAQSEYPQIFARDRLGERISERAREDTTISGEFSPFSLR